MITISEVAEYCNVSESTVSRVVNGSTKISRATTDVVLKAIKELGYVPTRKKKEKSKSEELLLVMPNTSLYTLGTTVQEMSLTLYESEYDIRIVNLHQERLITPEIARQLCKKNTAGIILYGCIVDEEAAGVFYAQQVPTIVQQGDTSQLVSVCVNNYNGMRDAVLYVLSRDYTDIALVGWSPNDFNIRARTDSYRNTLDEAGIDSSRILMTELDIQGGYTAMKCLYEQGLPEVVVFAADILAYGGIKFLHEKGIRYPEDIGLIGFDDAYLSEVLGLTSMYQLLQENARLVIENLLWMITHKTVSPPKEILLTPRLVVRNSLR
ncbi:MAG: LacI family transcriptional regulator [Spirochaetia bacterium]|nr:LacI family transcriptional regulator [Spirochaetia bacterium]